MRRARHPLAFALVVLLACAGPADSSRPAVRVAAAASLREPVLAVVGDLARRHPEVRVLPVFTATGTAVQQVIAGAGYDLLVAADTLHPALLEARGLAEPGTRRVFARGGLALWLAADVPGNGLEALRAPRVRRVAIAHPDVAPYGRAAVEALGRAGLYEAVQGKLVRGQDVAQAAQLAVAGADAALLPVAVARAAALRGRGRVVVLDTVVAPPVPHAVVIVHGQDRPPVRTVYGAFFDDAARAALARAGYEPVGAAP